MPDEIISAAKIYSALKKFFSDIKNENGSLLRINEYLDDDWWIRVTINFGYYQFARAYRLTGNNIDEFLVILAEIYFEICYLTRDRISRNDAKEFAYKWLDEYYSQFGPF